MIEDGRGPRSGGPGKSARSSVIRRVTRRMAGIGRQPPARESAPASGPGSARSARKRRGTASSRSGVPPRTPGGGVTVRDAGPCTRGPGLRPLGGPRAVPGLRGGGRDRLTRGGPLDGGSGQRGREGPGEGTAARPAVIVLRQRAGPRQPLGGGSGQGGREGPGEGTAVRPAVIVLRQCAGPRQPLGRCPAGQLGDDPGERPGAPPAVTGGTPSKGAAGAARPGNVPRVRASGGTTARATPESAADSRSAAAGSSRWPRISARSSPGRATRRCRRAGSARGRRRRTTVRRRAPGR